MTVMLSLLFHNCATYTFHAFLSSIVLLLLCLPQPECFLPANPTLSDLNNSTLLASPSTNHAPPPPFPTLTPLSTSPTHSTPAPSPQIRDETTFHVRCYYHCRSLLLGCDFCVDLYSPLPFLPQSRAGYEVEAPLVCYDPILTPPATLPRVPIPGPPSSHASIPDPSSSMFPFQVLPVPIFPFQTHTTFIQITHPSEQR